MMTYANTTIHVNKELRNCEMTLLYGVIHNIRKWEHGSPPLRSKSQGDERNIAKVDIRQKCSAFLKNDILFPA